MPESTLFETVAEDAFKRGRERLLTFDETRRLGAALDSLEAEQPLPASCARRGAMDGQERRAPI